MVAARQPGQFSSSSFRDDLVFEIDVLLGELRRGGSRVYRPRLEDMSLDELDEQYELTSALYREHLRFVAADGRRPGWTHDVAAPHSAFDAATRSPFSRQDIAERSG